MQFRLDAEVSGARLQVLHALLPQFRLWFIGIRVGRLPLRVGEAWPPPVFVRVELFPQQPDFARVLGEQVLARETVGYGEALRAFADQHDVSSVLEHGFRDQRDILDVAHASDRTSAAGGTVHAAGVEFDHAFFVRKSTETDAGVFGIVFWSLDHFESGVERVAAAFQEGVGFVEIVEAVIGADDDGALVGSGLCAVLLGCRTLFGVFCLGSGSYSGGDCS